MVLSEASAVGLLEPEAKTVGFQLPGPSDRVIIIATTGGGKTVAGAWLLSCQRLDMRPWIIIDFKNEELWDLVGFPPIKIIRLGDIPKKPGLYLVHVLPGQEDDIDDWFWKIWKHGNIGLFCDEVDLIPKGNAFKAILRQGRSKLIPVISCTQRPVGVDREVFSESMYKMILGLEDLRDMRTIQEFTKGLPRELQLPRYWSWWYDGKQRQSFLLRPVPNPHSIARDLRSRVPRGGFL